jgi:dienelactone hydrolase
MMKMSFPSCVLFLIILSGALLKAQSVHYDTHGIQDNLPVFFNDLKERQTFPLAWENQDNEDFVSWRKQAKDQVMKSLMQAPPVVHFKPEIIAEQDRGTYVVRKVAINITGDSRVLALMTVPKATGPHPAILLLHDHGARFDIGKEKVIEPFDVPVEKLESAREWINSGYGGRFIGDELAKLGYVCLAVDMLNWSDRGGAGYEGQQALASNFFNLGASYAGLIAYEDLRAAEFLSMQPETDPNRIAAMGLSVGGFRTWQLAALSEHIAAGVSVCWMATLKEKMIPGNNLIRGGSAYTMLHPGLSQYLDYPDVASIACPKPMMFCNGNKDPLFTPKSIQEGYNKMQKVWDSQNAGESLVTTLYDAPHEFNLEMQNDAFPWLDSILNQR